MVPVIITPGVDGYRLWLDGKVVSEAPTYAQAAGYPASVSSLRAVREVRAA